jgi:hypothetical protein
MSNNKMPINRIGKFFDGNDFNLELSFGEEWMYNDMNFTLVLYRVDKLKTKKDDVYGEAVSDAITFLPPVEFKGLVQVMAPENKYLGTSKIGQFEPGNLRVSVYQRHLDELEVDINYGDYIGYMESETVMRYYVVNNDGRVTSDNKHTYGGYKAFYRTIMASPVTNDEFRGL